MTWDLVWQISALALVGTFVMLALLAAVVNVIREWRKQ